MKTVLISGASVAGLTAAHWLRRQGFVPTVVERAPAPRKGGHAIDVRGVALEVLDRTGLLAQAREARTRMRGMSMLDRDGQEKWQSTEMTLSGGTFDNEDLEVVRGELVELLHGHAREGVEYLFEDSVTALREDADGVHVTFERAAPRSFDLLVGADGLHSRVRRLAFGPEEQFITHLGVHMAVYSSPNFLQLDNWQVWFGEENDTTFCLYPVRDNAELRVTVGFGSESARYDYRDTGRQKALVDERVRHLGWETPALLKAMWEASDFYFDAAAQVHMASWSSGRVVLLGDAGYCPSPLSGQGTSLALVGAYVLAAELAAADGDHLSAFARYEQRLRPFAEVNQRVALAAREPAGSDGQARIDAVKNEIALGA